MRNVAGDILSYKGDPNAVGGPGVAEPKYDALTQSARDLALAGYEQNRNLYEQRIKDRDEMFKMIDDEKLIPNNVADVDRPGLRAAVQDFQDYFYKHGDKIMSDPAKFNEFRTKYANAAEMVKDAQKKYMAINAETTALKDVKDPVELKKRQEYIAKMYHAPITDIPKPYVAISPFNLGIVQADPMFTQTKQKGLYTQSVLNVDATFDQYRKNWMQDAYNHQFKEFVDKINMLPDPQATVNQLNSRLAEKNKILKSPSLTPLTIVQTPQGWKFNESDYIVAAKMRIADEPTPVRHDFNRDQAAYKEGMAGVAARLAEINLTRDKYNYMKQEDVANGQAIVNELADAIYRGEQASPNATTFDIASPDLLRQFSKYDQTTGKIYDAPDAVRYDKNTKMLEVYWSPRTESDPDNPGVPKTVPERKVQYTERQVLRDIVGRTEGLNNRGMVMQFMDNVVGAGGSVYDISHKWNTGGNNPAPTNNPTPGNNTLNATQRRNKK